ncbi:MAG: TonB-dependent receptor [Gammaproteobacteria bacterium]
MRRSINSTLAAFVMLAMASSPALAEIEEIVVTARKREENLQDLPMSVTAIGAEAMERLGIRNLADVTRYTPGVNLDTAFGLNDQRLVIRGLSPSRGRPNSAILVDGIDLTTESITTAGGSMYFNQRLLDIERVEVVKGPQSALYGRAAFTGAIQYVTRDPAEEEWETIAGLDIGDHGRQFINAGVSGPIVDGLGIGFAGMAWNDDGFYREGLTGSSLGGGDGFGLSNTIKWDNDGIFSVRGRIAYSKDEYDQQATFYDPVNTLISPPDSSAGVINPDALVGLFAGEPAGADGRQAFLTVDPNSNAAYEGGEVEALNTSLRLSWEFSAGTITSYTGYVNGESSQVFDGDFDVRLDDTQTTDVARGGTEIDFQTDTRLFSQEFRFASTFEGPVQFTVGALYWDEKSDQTELGVSVLSFPFGVDGVANPRPEGHFNNVSRIANRLPNEVDRDIDSYSVYGLVEWDITQAWRLSFESRFAREEMEVRGSGCDPSITAANFRCIFSTPDIANEFPAGEYSQLPRVYAVDSTSDDYFAPKAVIEWTPLDNLMSYFSISQGVKPGGISTVASGTWMDQEPDGDLDELKFDAEELLAFETGLKTTWLDRTLVLNGALFYQDYTDKQIPVQNISAGGVAFTIIENAGEAEVWGFELETIWQPIESIRLQLGYSWLDGEYTDLEYITNSANSIARAGNCTPINNDTQCRISLTGNSLEDVPEHSVVALAGYYPPFGGSGVNGLFEADVEYQSSRYTEEFNDRKLQAYSLLNLRAGVQMEKWDALLYVNNVFDDDNIKSWSSSTGLVATSERTNADITAFPGEGFSIGPPPRHWGVRANFRF